MKPGFIAAVLVALTVTGGHAAGDHTVQTSPQDDRGPVVRVWRPLFDGKTLAGWQFASGRHVDKGWVVEDGILHRKAGVGSIFTDEEFGDFELQFVWKIARRGNAGLKYRVRHYDPGIYGPGYLGYEFQMFDDERLKPSAATSTGGIYDLMAPVSDKPSRPTGEWNEGRVIAIGSHIEHWLNGQRVLAVDTSTDDWNAKVAASKFAPINGFARASRGRIELQDHDHPVWFKSISIRELGAASRSSRSTTPHAASLGQ